MTHSQSSGTLHRLWTFWIFWTALLFACRVGEAAVPGPSEPNNCTNVQTWNIGVCNPSGLQGKGQVLTTIDADFVAVSETHFSKESTAIFQAGLRSMGSPFKTVVPGFPMAHRTTASATGNWAGVAFVSKVPCRTVATPWPADAFETGRAQIATFFADQRWVTGGVVYGYPEGKTHVNAKSRTNDLLTFVFHHLTQLQGPRFVAGDWNYEPGTLEVESALRHHGWVEIQTLNQCITGLAPQKTCKNCTQKDYLWMSPELARSFQSFELSNDVFADHAVLVAKFRRSQFANVQYLWPCPQQVPWTKVPPAEAVVDFSHGDPTDLFASCWQQREQAAQTALGDSWSSRMRGRGQQTKPRQVKSSLAPLKASRASEIQPMFYGFHVQHARWFRQLRRLQNYCLWRKSHDPTRLGSVTHGLGLWRSIRLASGFAPSFAAWWPGRKYRCPSDPLVVPDVLPDHPTAVAIFDAFQCEVRELERALLAATRARRKAQRAKDPNLIFHDLRRPAPQPVETLLKQQDLPVVAIDQEFHGLVVSGVPRFDPSHPVLVGGKSRQVIAQDTDTVWVDDISGITESMSVVQTQHIGELPELFRAFHEQWQARWCRHDQVPHSQWQQIIDFARTVFPGHPVAPVTVDAHLLKAEAARKKPRSATGLDGISRADLLQVDDTVAASMASMMTRACTDGIWPAQVIAGKVSSLAKTESACTVNQYRPITIFSFLYRCWSSLNARALLDAADSWAHPDIFGNRKGFQAAHLWREIVSTIEDAYQHNLPLAGLTADVEKAFNCLPRWPILNMALFAGASFHTVMGWAGALTDMVRHFKIQNSFSAGFRTSTGLAEGCALSCYGMLLLDHTFHHWLHSQTTMVRCLSYVDNLDFLTHDPTFAVKQLDYVLEFAAMADLTIDRKKTFGWSVSAEVRARMKQAGLPTRMYARDLGAHLGFSRQFTNSTVIDRFKALQAFWPRLKASLSPFRVKLRALRSVAWSRGLYAISSAPVGKHHWLSLRRNATEALGFQRPGSNPLLYLGLVEHADPEFVALVNTVRDARDFVTFDMWEQTVLPYALNHVTLHPGSTAKILVDRLFDVGLQCHAHGRVADSFGSFSLLRANFAEILLRLEWSWNSAVATHVAHRKDFLGLVHVDASRSRAVLAKHTMAQQSLLKLAMTGAFVTNEVTGHWNEAPGTCQWCGQLDSLHHRFWTCPQTAPLRTQHAPAVTPLVDSVPPALSLHAWALRPPVWPQWMQMLCQHDTSVPSMHGHFSAGWNHVFTDGSCLFQSDPVLRVASWSAVLVPPRNPTWNFPAGRVLGASPLFGVCQTSFRAELYAVAIVVHWAALAKASVAVWTDCQGVFLKCQLLFRGKMRIKRNTPNADLWEWLETSVAILGPDRVRIHKVAAHKPMQAATSRHEVWTFWNNACADKAAKVANLNRSLDFWALWQQLGAEQQVLDKFHSEVVALHLAVAELSIRTKNPEALDPVLLKAPKKAREFPLVFDLGSWNGRHLDAAFAHRYGGQIPQRIRLWWTTRVGDPPDTPSWISFCHLYIDYQMSFGCSGPYNVDGQLVDATSRPFLDAAKTPFPVRLRWFRNCLKWFFKCHGIQIGLETTRCRSEMLLCHLACASVVWDPWCLNVTEGWLAANLKQPCIRGTDALKALPLVRQTSGMSLSRLPLQS